MLRKTLPLRLGAALRVLPLLLLLGAAVLMPAVAGAQEPVPGKPTGLSADMDTSGSSVVLTWNAPTDGGTVSGYQISRRAPATEKDLSVQVDNTGNANTTYTDATVKGNTKYIYRVKAVSGGGVGAMSMPAQIITGEHSQVVASKPDKPSGLSARSTAGDLNLSVSWNAAAGASEYKLSWRQPGEGFGRDSEVVTTDTEAAFAVSEAGQWIVRLDGCNDVGCTKADNLSLEVIVMPKASPSVCERTPEVRDALVGITGKDCGYITANDLAGVTVLDLTNDDITALKNGDFNDLSNLQDLNLSYNDLTALPEDVFDGLSNLQKLDLFDNMIASLPEDVFDGLSNLVFIDLNCGRMTTLPEDVFEDLPNLQSLILSEGYLTELPEDVFDGLSNLQRLYIGDNKLTALPEDVFDGLSNLQFLDIGTNGLTALPEDVFDGLSNLRTLWLFSNELNELSEDMFDDLPSLSRLRLYNNPGYPFELDLGEFVLID